MDLVAHMAPPRILPRRRPIGAPAQGRARRAAWRDSSAGSRHRNASRHRAERTRERDALHDGTISTGYGSIGTSRQRLEALVLGSTLSHRTMM
jgi:hypothetical protein